MKKRPGTYCIRFAYALFDFSLETKPRAVATYTYIYTMAAEVIQTVSGAIDLLSLELNKKGGELSSKYSFLIQEWGQSCSIRYLSSIQKTTNYQNTGNC